MGQAANKDGLLGDWLQQVGVGDLAVRGGCRFALFLINYQDFADKGKATRGVHVRGLDKSGAADTTVLHDISGPFC